MFSLKSSLALVAFASYAAAQTPPLTAQCQATLANIATNSDVNTCLTPSPLLGILTGGNSSVIGPIDKWLTSLCAAPACNNNTLAAIVTNVTNGCPTEAAAFGLKKEDGPAVVQIVQKFYPTVRQVVCLKDGNTNCVTQTLTNIESVTGPLTLTNIGSLLSGGFEGTSIPKNITCTNCIKAAANIINGVDASFLSKEALKETCGESFADGNTPVGITQSASSNTAGTGSSGNGGNGASTLFLDPLSALSAILTLGGFTLLI